MKSILLQSKSSSTSTATATASTTTEEEDHRDNNNSSSCYYPFCKKDANCSCEICLASINATLDLMPMSIHKSSVTKLSASTRPNNVHCTPISFDASNISTPRSTSVCHVIPSTPAIKSSARSDLNRKLEKEEEEEKEGSWGFPGLCFLRFLMGLGFLLSAGIVFSRVVNGTFRPVLSPDSVRRVGEKCWRVQDMNGKLRFLQNELTSVVVGGKVSLSNCSYSYSTWKISQDGVLLNSRCTFYKSAIEEVTIWGWPLQTAGLLTTGFSSRTFTILSGRVTEWNSGQVGYVIRKENASWVQPKWGASVVQLDPNTWVLEYRRSSIFDGTRLHSAALEFLKYRISRFVGRVKRNLWLIGEFGDSLYYNWFTSNNGNLVPT